MDVLYDLAHLVFFFLFKAVFRFRVYGHENVPKRGPVIIACNHASFLDPALVGTAMWRRVNFIAKEELFRNPVMSFWLRSWRSFPVRREQLDKKVLREILDKLAAGEALGVFPEGTRGPGGEMLPGKPGIGMIVSMAKAPVVPVYIKGSHLSLGKVHKGFRPVPVTMTFGKPMEFKAAKGGRGSERYQAVADEIMAEIEKLKRAAG